jgi:phosphatidylglycerophosphatase A
MDRLRELLATFFFLGYAPVASGTVGSAGALAVAWGLTYLTPSVPYAAAALPIVLITLALGIPLGDWAERRYGKKDPSPFVLDEVMGYFVGLCYFWAARPGLDDLVVVFFLFRIFDVIKPPPARKIESLKGGWGIMLDDGIAGLYTLIGIAVYHAITHDPTISELPGFSF